MSVCVCASVVMKLRFRCTASYSATKTALLALDNNTDKGHWENKTVEVQNVNLTGALSRTIINYIHLHTHTNLIHFQMIHRNSAAY